MGKKSSGTPPPAPDYAAIAKQQGQASIDAANANANIGRVNQSNPYGSVDWSQGANGQWSANTTLAPEQQALLKQLQGGQLASLNQVSSMQAPNYSGLPALQSSVSPQGYQSQSAGSVPNTSLNFSGAPAVASGAPAQSSLDFSGAQALQQPNLQGSIDMSGLPQLNQDYGAQRQQVQDALYKQQTQMLDPQYQQEEEANRARLINSGISPGSQAYDQQMNDFYRQKQQAYGSAQTNAILAGGQEQSRLNSDANTAYGTLFGAKMNAGNFANNSAIAGSQTALANRQQGVGETTAQGNFANAAGQQNFQNSAAARQLATGETAQQAAFGNQAAQQGFNQNFAATDANNTSALNLFSQQMANANLANATRQQGVNEANTIAQFPLQQYGALFGTNLNMPQAQQFGAQGVQAVDYTGAADKQQQAAQQLFNYQSAEKKASNPWGNILGAAGSFFTGDWGAAGQQVGGLFGSSGTQYGG